MNTAWSTKVQTPETLYYTRMLRFSDMFCEKYRSAFNIDDKRSILEIGCGPGALTQALSRWYPKATITGTDRDRNFIHFAKEKAPHLSFSEQDATALLFENESFDVTISNTVSEHIEPSAFYREQYRVLKSGGVCLVLSARKGIVHHAPFCLEETDFEKEIYQRTEKRFTEFESQFPVCAFPMNEMEMPIAMQKYGFREVSTEYLTINLTPDNPIYSKEMAHAMIEAHRQSALNAARVITEIAGDIVSRDEIEEMKRLQNERYDKRLALYDAGVKQWDTYTSLTMVLRGIK